MHRKNIFPKINSKNYKFSVFFPARIPVPAMPEPESKFFVSVPLTPYHAEAFHEPDEIGRGQEKAQLRDEHDGAKERRGKSR